MIEDLLPIGLLIVVAKLLECLLDRVGLSSIVAYTAAGLILGPIAGIVEPSSKLQIFLGIGVFILFFLVGLDEIDIPGFVATIRGRFFCAAIVSVVISMVAAMVVTSDLFNVDFALELDFRDALALAGILSMSSLGLVAKVLADRGFLKEPLGLEIFTTVIIAEMVTLLVVGFSIGEHTIGAHDHLWGGAASVVFLLAQVAAFAVVAWILSARVMPPTILFLKRLFNVPELSFGLLIGGLFLMVVVAEKMGLHGALGALLFGAALSGLPRQVHNDVMPGIRSAAEGLFVPLFFASAGLRLDLSFLSLPVATIIAVLTVPAAGKFAGAFIGAYVARLDKPYAQAAGLMAKGVAEIALLLVLLENGVIGQDVFSLVVLAMFGYIVLMPQAISSAVNKARLTHRPTPPDVVPTSFARRALDDITAGHVLDPSRSYPDVSLSIRKFADDWIVPDQQDYVVVDNGAVAGTVSPARLTSVPMGSWADTPLQRVLRPDPPHVEPDEPIADVLQKLSRHSMSVIPVRDKESHDFLGTITSHDVIDLVLLMDEIADELKEMESHTAN